MNVLRKWVSYRDKKRLHEAREKRESEILRVHTDLLNIIAKDIAIRTEVYIEALEEKGWDLESLYFYFRDGMVETMEFLKDLEVQADIFQRFIKILREKHEIKW